MPIRFRIIRAGLERNLENDSPPTRQLLANFANQARGKTAIMTWFRKPSGRIRALVAVCVLGAGACPCPGSALTQDEVIGIKLALQLAEEGDARGAAIEFRRLGMLREAPERQAAYFWYAAYHYLLAGDPVAAEPMLDRADDVGLALEDRILVLRAEAAAARGDRSAARFYWDSLLRDPSEPDQAALARRRLAALKVREGRMQAARTLLRDAEPPDRDALARLSAYETGTPKKPVLGGVLGIVPGLGYAYAGEYANALRSLLLNALFIYGMVDTAQNNQWGGFAVITFFEITWFSGSIYGGIDASHRYNARRLQQVIEGIEGDAAAYPDRSQLPAIVLRYRF